MFLCSDQARYVIGQELAVDGGLRINTHAAFRGEAKAVAAHGARAHVSINPGWRPRSHAEPANSALLILSSRLGIARQRLV
jgi:hypothetical protein